MAFIEKSRDRDAAGPDLRPRPAPHCRACGGADTIKLERFGMSGVSYQSASLGRCTMHQMYYGVAGKTSVGLRDEGRRHGHLSDRPDLGRSEARHRSHRQNDDGLLLRPLSRHLHGPRPTPLGVDDIWDSGYSWYMNAWVQAIVWRYKDGSLRVTPPLPARRD